MTPGADASGVISFPDGMNRLPVMIVVRSTVAAACHRDLVSSESVHSGSLRSAGKGAASARFLDAHGFLSGNRLMSGKAMQLSPRKPRTVSAMSSHRQDSMHSSPSSAFQKNSRRSFGVTAVVAGAGLVGAGGRNAVADSDGDDVPADYRITHKRIRQSVMGWCFNPMPTSQLIDHCAAIGLEGIEGIDRKFYAEARSKGLKVSLVSSHGFATGPVDRANHDECVARLREAIDVAVDMDCQNVITFTGMRVAGMTDAIAEQNCLDCWKQVIAYAEEKHITLVLEHLNSKDDSHPMKGHPGYFGDDVERCFDLVRRMDSPSFRLLFDIYHVQIMNGDIIRRIRSNHALIGHYHTAGNPGRCELDDHQEINYPAVMHAIVETGYTGFVAQEFLPTWNDPVAALRHAARVCDV